MWPTLAQITAVHHHCMNSTSLLLISNGKAFNTAVISARGGHTHYCFDSLCSRQQFLSHVGAGLPELNLYLAEYPTPMKNHKARWADDGPPLVVFGSSLLSQKKTPIDKTFWIHSCRCCCETFAFNLMNILAVRSLQTHFTLTFCMLGNFHAFLSSLIFFKINSAP